ncbi:glucose-6-phosphate isomerase [Thermomonospora sp. CIF 1]|uniref:glucose-6-phosphate isomerase n=1 Tax=Thermomonospora sp. CIF 1 TaxID=1916083 RepID=UPI000A637249|nr:glucose-6-phosphate isomerase [Thermomonospora sp. CIF 1]PKK14074.1 MAG: glucose-6-phosphate isomerase [Thermomonospora sp. CIF 1]
MTSVVTAGGVSVTLRGAVVDRAAAVTERLISDGVPAALAAGNPQLWGPGAVAEASKRLGWLKLAESSRPLLPRLAELAERVRADGLDRVVLAGMGGSSLAPEVITRTAGVELTVLDTTDPQQVAAVVGDRLERTVVVVSSKSGGTIETDSHRRVFEGAFAAAGITGAELARRFVVVTDPGSPLEEAAHQAGYTVVLADPDVGGRYSALSAFGLVPSALAGAQVAGLLEEAAALTPSLRQPYDNPSLTLGAALGASALAGRDKLAIADRGSGIVAFGDWAEQLIAESTGKDGKGILPVVVEGVDAPGFTGGEDVCPVVLGGGFDGDGLGVTGPLGAQFLLWEYATAVAGRVLGINPFDQPNVQESKDNTAALLRAADGDAPTVVAGEPALVVDAVEVHAPPELVKGAKDLSAVLEAVVTAVPERGYLAVMAYLDRMGDAAAERLRPLLAEASARLRKTAVPVTFGWGPRFLHSTGQYHKGGPQNGVFVQITGECAEDLPVPGKPYTLRQLQLAQAFGDLRALRSRGRPAVRFHLRDRAAGVRQLLSALA